MTQEIDALLQSYHSATLWDMAHAASLTVVDRYGQKLRKQELIAKMKAEFFTRERVRTSLAELPKRDRAVLDHLLRRGGTISTRRLRNQILRSGLATRPPDDKPQSYTRVPYAQGYVGQPHRHRSRTFEDVIARLTYRGLVFSRDPGLTSGGSPYKLQFHPGATLYVPKFVRRYLPDPEPASDDAPAWQPDRIESGAPALLLRDLYLYWDLMRRNTVTLLKSGVVGKRWLKAINEMLLVPDPSLEDARREDDTGRLFLLRRMLETLGLARRTTRHLQVTDQDPLHVPDFWGWPTTEQLRACLEAWLTMGTVEQLGHDAGSYNPRYAHARRVLVDALKAFPPSTWVELDELLERVQDRDRDFLFLEHSQIESYRGNWYYGHTTSYYYGHPQELLEAFEGYEAEFVRRCLQGFLLQVGAIELGFGRSKESVEAFRLTPIGPAVLGAASPSPVTESTADQTGKLIIQPNFQLIAMGPISLALLAQIDLFAEREQADRGAFQYLLSRESVYRGQQAGLEVADVIRFLEEASAFALPQNVQRSLEEWGAQHEQIVFRTGTSILQAADADLLSKLSQNAKTGEYLARSITPEMALVQAQADPKLIAALLELGLFPAISAAEPTDVEQSVIIDKDGTIRPVHSVPGLHLRGRLSQFAEEVMDSTWRLTPESVQRAAGDRKRVVRLLKELRKLHRGPFPPELVQQIKTWGGYYGQVRTETLTLLEFRDKTTLEELCAHPTLTRFLTPFSAGDRALAVVSEDNLAYVKQALADLGVRAISGLKR